MRFVETRIPGVMVAESEPLEDQRGSFARAFCTQEFRDAGFAMAVVQCNTSFNRNRGTLRGMHYQAAPAAEAKAVRCTRGRVFDVAVDLRPDSPELCRWTATELAPEEHRAHLIPEGCAHGFITLAEDSEVFYLMGRAHSPEHARGVRWDDPAFAIEWPLRPSVISERDAGFADFIPPLAPVISA